jgi:hypothetical protein
MSQPNLLSGARGIISYVDTTGVSRTLGLALDISVNVTAGVRTTLVMGHFAPVASDPTGMDCTCSIGIVIPINKSVVPTGASQSAPLPGSNRSNTIDLGLEPKIIDALTSQSLQIDLMDQVTNKITASIRGARFSGRSTSLNAQDVATTRLNYTAIFDAGYGGDENNGVKLGYQIA